MVCETGPRLSRAKPKLGSRPAKLGSGRYASPDQTEKARVVLASHNYNGL